MTYSRANGACVRQEIASTATRVGESESFDISTYADQIHIAEAELAAFISAVAQLFGPEQSRTSTEDWLEEAELWIAHLYRRIDAGVRLPSQLPLDWRPESRPHGIGRGLSSPRIVPRYRQYHRPIVSLQLFWFDVGIDGDGSRRCATRTTQ